MATTVTADAVVDHDWEYRMRRQRVRKRYMHDVLLEYFVVEGHQQAAEAFCKESGCSDIASLGAMEHRVAIRGAIAAGDIADAVRRLNRLDPSILEDIDLKFLVWRQQFVEHVRTGDVDKALALAQGTLLPMTEAKPELLPALERSMALLAFPDPARSPIGDLMSASQRDETARRVNSAVLTAFGHPTESRLPKALKQLVRAQKRLRTQCAFPEMLDIASARIAPERGAGGPSSSGAGVGVGAGAGMFPPDASGASLPPATLAPSLRSLGRGRVHVHTSTRTDATDDLAP